MRKVLNCAQTMAALHVSRATVRDMLAKGELQGFRRGKIVRVTAESVERLLNGVGTELSPEFSGGTAERRVTSPPLAKRSS